MAIGFLIASGVNFLFGLFIYFVFWRLMGNEYVFLIAYPLGIVFNYFSYSYMHDLPKSLQMFVSFSGSYVIAFIVSFLLYWGFIISSVYPPVAYVLSSVLGLVVVFLWVRSRSR